MLHNPIKLRKLLKDKIEADGPVTFRQFMAECLYHQDLGYYSRIDLPIGKKGDFVTAPHASRFFGSLLAVQIEDFVKRSGNRSLDICEFGAGAGYLASDLLAYLQEYEPEYFENLTYFIVEPLDKRKKVLGQELSKFRDTVKIINEFSDCGSFSGVIVANELLDAFPVHLVQRDSGELKEIYVGLDEEGNFCEVMMEPSASELVDYLDSVRKRIPEGYRTEVNLGVRDWIKEISTVMETGFVLVIDYGFSADEYLAPHRNRGTLLGYSGQRTTEDFFSYPGMVDITAHVNFSDLKKWAEDHGMKCLGYTPQWAFLGGLDPDETMQRVFGQVDPFSPVLAGIKALIFPHAMGESHKVMVLSKGMEDVDTVKGFRIRDYKDQLT